MGWRRDARDVIRDYPRLKQKERDLKSVSAVANYGTPATMNGKEVNVLLPGGGSASRTTEDVALRRLPPEEQRKLDAVSMAITVTLGRYSDGKRRLNLIDILYWKSSHYLQGAADQLYISYTTARRWNDAFVELVDAYMKIF